MQQVRGPWPWGWHCQSQQDLFRALAVFSCSHENSSKHQFNKTYQNDLQTEITSLSQLKIISTLILVPFLHIISITPNNYQNTSYETPSNQTQLISHLPIIPNPVDSPPLVQLKNMPSMLRKSSTKQASSLRCINRFQPQVTTPSVCGPSICP